MSTVVDIPEELMEGEFWNVISPDPDWVWTVEHEGRVVGFLMAGGAHGIAFMLRLKVAKDAPQECLLQLLRKFLSDAEQRGCRVYLTWLNLLQPQEAKLARILMRAGGTGLDIKHVMCGGTVEQAARF